MTLSQLSRMRATPRQLSLLLFAVVGASWASGQTAEPAAGLTGSVAGPAQAQPFSPASIVLRIPVNPEVSAAPASVQPLLGFRDSEVKFSLADLMSLLRDHRHEGWVLAAYPDPNTGYLRGFVCIRPAGPNQPPIIATGYNSAFWAAMPWTSAPTAPEP